MTTWQASVMPPVRPRPLGILRGLLRGVVMGLVVYSGLALLLVVRAVEYPLFSPRRPVTPWITQGVCRVVFGILGIRLVRRGVPMQHAGAMVANHASWLDIFGLNAVARVYFVAKSEVHGWAGIGWLARATGTVFIARRGVEAKAQQRMFEARLQMGHRLVFFPEGTSTDGQRVLPFKSSLFEAFLTTSAKGADLWIQPVTLQYTQPTGRDPRFYGWWGEMTFAGHLWSVLTASPQGALTLTYHPPISVAAMPDRKALASACETAIRNGFVADSD